MDDLESAFAAADYVTINMPYIKGVTHHAINADVLGKMKPGCHILNMARGEIVDGDALKALYKSGHTGKYICDFADEFMQNHPNFMCAAAARAHFHSPRPESIVHVIPCPYMMVCMCTDIVATCRAPHHLQLHPPPGRLDRGG